MSKKEQLVSLTIAYKEGEYMDYESTPIYNKKKYIKKEIDEFKPIVSIITPYYNSKDYIEETALSVLSQSFPWFEWIIVDDGSTDKESLEKLEKLEKEDKRIKIFHKKNEGLAATRDYGAKKSCHTSKYLLFLDDDDLIESNYLECLYYSLETNEKACFAYTNTVGFGEINYLWDKKMDIETEIKENLLVATALIRKKDFFEVGGYGTKEKGINEDWIFWIKLFSKSKIPLKVNYYGFWYRRKKTGELKKSLDNINKTTELMNKYINNVDYDIKPISYPKDDYQWDDTNRVDNPFKTISKIKDERVNIIMIMPHIVVGGADKFNIDFLKGLSSKYYVTAIFTNVSDNEWISEFKKYVNEYYILPSFLERKYWHLFISYLIEKNNSKLLFNTNSIYGYMVIPYIKSMYKNIKIIDYVHMEEWYNRNGGYSRDSSSVASCIDKTLVCNKSSERILIDYFKRDKNEIDTVYIGVDEKHFYNEYTKEEKEKIKEKYNIEKNKKIISFIARIAEQKRPYLLAEILKEYTKKYDDSIFLICGDGPLLNELKEKVKEYELENVLFLGVIKNTKEIYGISDCTLNCSIKEGLALTTYESLSMDVPVISARVGGQEEIINNEVGVIIEPRQDEKTTSHVYSSNEINDYVNGIRKVIENIEKYKKKCRKRVVSGFTISLMNKKMNTIINDILKTPNKKAFNNKDIALELLNQYLLNTNEEYQYSISMFNKKYEEPKMESEKRFIERISEKIDSIGSKLHLYYELRAVRDIIASFFNLILSIIKLPIIIIKRIINFFSK